MVDLDTAFDATLAAMAAESNTQGAKERRDALEFRAIDQLRQARAQTLLPIWLPLRSDVVQRRSAFLAKRSEAVDE